MIIFITGTDTGVGKTFLAANLIRRLVERDVPVAAVKPLCSGGREDAGILLRALRGRWSLATINPWHFRAPLAPLLAARQEGREIQKADVLVHLRWVIETRAPRVLIVEGAGGLLSPLGEDFNAADLIGDLRARALVVCPNRLGAVNQALLVRAALPRATARDAQFVLVGAARPDAATKTNPVLLKEFADGNAVHLLPWIRRPSGPRLSEEIRNCLDAILGVWGV